MIRNFNLRTENGDNAILCFFVQKEISFLAGCITERITLERTILPKYLKI